MKNDKDIAELRVERHLDSDSGEIIVNYFWKDAPVPKVVLSGEYVQRMSGLSLIHKDLGSARRWIDKAHQLAQSLGTSDSSAFQHLANRDIADDIKAYFIAALTFYGKVFTEAAGRRAQASRDWLDARFRATHDLYLDYRHNVAAHSGDKKFETTRSFLLLIPDTGFIRIATNRTQPDLLYDENYENDFRGLIDHVGVKVDERYEKMAKRLTLRAALKGHQFWESAAASDNPVDADTFVHSK